jgi:hypothetical protein
MSEGVHPFTVILIVLAIAALIRIGTDVALLIAAGITTLCVVAYLYALVMDWMDRD